MHHYKKNHIFIGITTWKLFLSEKSLINTGEPESILQYSVKISGFENPMGGPDIAENNWNDSDNESGLSYDWIDISSIDTDYNFTDNDEAGY